MKKIQKQTKKRNKKQTKKKRIRAKPMLFMDIVDDDDDDDDDQLYPAICSILPVQYSRLQLYYCNKN